MAYSSFCSCKPSRDGWEDNRCKFIASQHQKFFQKILQLVAENTEFSQTCFSKTCFFLNILGESGFLKCLRDVHREMQGNIPLFCTLPPMPWSPWRPLPGDGDHPRGESFDRQERWGVSAEPTGLCSSSSAQLSVEGNLIVHFHDNFFQVSERYERERLDEW